MSLSPDFTFSQHSLGDFADCPRRFYLRYVLRQPWPLVEAGPLGDQSALEYQAYLRKGALLHRWIERHWLGMDAATNARTDDPELRVWWERFVSADLNGLPPERFPELALAAPLGAYRLYARFDLLAAPGPDSGAGDWVVVDWKTLRGASPPSYGFLKNRIQTRAYLYVLATAGSPFNRGQPPPPERCVMRYWLANFPERPWVEIRYSRDELEADRARLTRLVERIANGVVEADFPLTDDERKCTYCNFRTRCRRAGAPGDEPPPDEETAADFDAAPALEY